MISISAHEAAASSLREVKSSIDNLITTLQTAKRDVEGGGCVEIDGEDILQYPVTQLGTLIDDCETLKGQIDPLADSIVDAARQVYNEELRLEEERKKKKKDS